MVVAVELHEVEADASDATIAARAVGWGLAPATAHRVEADRRRVTVGLTPHGLDTIEKLFPIFNNFEATMSTGLSSVEKQELARLLRVVITNASD